MSGKAVDTYPFTIKFVPESDKTPKMYYKDVHRYFFVFDSIPDQYEPQEICNIVVSSYPFLIVYCPDKYKTQRMCDEAVDDSLVALNIITDWLVTVKIIKKLCGLCTDDGLHYFDENSGDVTFCCNEIVFFV